MPGTQTPPILAMEMNGAPQDKHSIQAGTKDSW